MGKASRKKRDSIASATEKRIGARRQEVKLFLRSIGFQSSDPSPGTWEHFLEIFPAGEVHELGDAIAARAEDLAVPAPYSLMWRSPKWARETYGWFAPITVAWLARLADLELRAKRILDLGCGPGVHACFLAKKFPEAEVIGVDISEQGLNVASDLASQLKLSNVRFLQADLDSLAADEIGGPVGIVLASTLLGDAHSEGFRSLTPPDPWSTSTSVETLLHQGYIEGVEAIAALLSTNGTYVGLERASVESYANWLGGLARCGLRPDPTRSGHINIRTLGQAERLSLVLADRDTETPLSMGDMLALVRKEFADAFVAEDELHADPPVSRVWGVEIQVVDEEGGGRTRVDYLRLSSGRTVRFESTTRGHRELRAVTGNIALQIDNDRAFVNELLETDPRVVAVQELPALT